MTRLNDIGASLVSARISHGLTQRELAARLGVHQQQIARWEGELYGCVSLSRILKVADALGLVGSAVLSGDGEQQSLLAAEEQTGYGSALLDPPREPKVTPVRDLGEVVSRIRAHAADLRDRYGVVRIDAFGSFARGEQRADSDVDLIVEVSEPTLETVFGAERRLGEILGRETQAGSLETLNPRVRRNVEEELVNVWQSE